jgi:hypothetical protein
MFLNAIAKVFPRDLHRFIVDTPLVLMRHQFIGRT